MMFSFAVSAARFGQTREARCVVSEARGLARFPGKGFWLGVR